VVAFVGKALFDWDETLRNENDAHPAEPRAPAMGAREEGA
jgi:hypothetical protein